MLHLGIVQSEAPGPWLGALLAKTLKGLAKQVPLAQTQSVVRQQRASVRQAGQVVGQWPPAQKKRGAQSKALAELITAAAEALRDGAFATDLEAFLNGLALV